MPAPHLLQSFADTQYPVQGADVDNEQLFSVFDPGRDALLSLFVAAINAELAWDLTTTDPLSPWAAAVAGTPLAARLPVADTCFEMPRRSIFRETMPTFPLLALYRTEAEHDELTLARERVSQTWGLDYVPGPLDRADFRRLGGALAAVRQIVTMTIGRRSHPAYQADARQFGPGAGNFDTVALVSSTEGPAVWGQQNEGIEIHALSMVLKTTELTLYNPAEVPPFQGATVTLGVSGPGGTLPDVVIARTEVPLQEPIGTSEPRR